MSCLRNIIYGEKKKAIEIARNLAANGMTDEQIKSITGLDVEEWR